LWIEHARVFEWLPAAADVVHDAEPARWRRRG
jgi:hypothetical protein